MLNQAFLGSYLPVVELQIVLKTGFSLLYQKNLFQLLINRKVSSRDCNIAQGRDNDQCQARWSVDWGRLLSSSLVNLYCRIPRITFHQLPHTQPWSTSFAQLQFTRYSSLATAWPSKLSWLRPTVSLPRYYCPTSIISERCPSSWEASAGLPHWLVKGSLAYCINGTFVSLVMDIMWAFIETKSKGGWLHIYQDDNAHFYGFLSLRWDHQKMFNDLNKLQKCKFPTIFRQMPEDSRIKRYQNVFNLELKEGDHFWFYILIGRVLTLSVKHHPRVSSLYRTTLFHGWWCLTHHHHRSSPSSRYDHHDMIVLLWNWDIQRYRPQMYFDCLMFCSNSRTALTPKIGQSISYKIASGKVRNS